MESFIPKIPAGIADHNYEFFENDGDIFYLQNGKVCNFMELNTDYHYIIRHDLEKRPQALKAMYECGITDWMDQNKRWAICNFGDFDNRADITTEGIIVHEHVKCKYRGSCKYEGIICLPVEAQYGTLTPRELQIIKMVAYGMLDKNIADCLGMALNTMYNHRAKIEQKIGRHNKAGIVAFAYENNLI